MNADSKQAIVISAALAVILAVVGPTVYYLANQDAYSSATWNIVIKVEPKDSEGFEIIVPYIIHQNISFMGDFGNKYRTYRFSLVETNLGTGLSIKGNGTATFGIQREYVLERGHLDFFSNDPVRTNGLKWMAKPNITLCAVNESDYHPGNALFFVFLADASPTSAVDCSMDYTGYWGLYEHPFLLSRTGGGGYRSGNFSASLSPGWNNITGWSTPSKVHGDPAGPQSNICLALNAVAVGAGFTSLTIARFKWASGRRYERKIEK